MGGQAGNSNLVLHLPLAYDGDLTEVVSGSNSWNNTRNISWDAAENAYLFKAKQNTNASYLNNLNLPITTLLNLNWTIEFDIKAVSFVQYIPCMALYNGNTCTATQYIYNSAGGSGGYAPANQWAHIKIIRYLGGSFDYYTDDVYICTKQQTDSNLTPSRFAVLASPWSSAGVDSQAYIKDIKITLN
jgi:hypothetical protein